MLSIHTFTCTFKPLQWLQPPCQLLACLLACKTFSNFPLGKIWVLTCQLADILIEKEMCPNDYNQPCTVRLSGYSKNPKTGPMIGPQKGRGYVGPSNISQITAKSWMMKTDKRFMPWKDPFFLILFIFLFCRRYLWPHKGGFISIWLWKCITDVTATPTKAKWRMKDVLLAYKCGSTKEWCKTAAWLISKTVKEGGDLESSHMRK